MNERDAALDGLRGVAALSVVIYHCTLIVGPGPGWLWPLAVLYDGPDAVVMFFVLSGYVLSLPYLAGRPPGYLSFIIRRFCRIWLPCAAVILLAAAVLPASPVASPWLADVWSPVTIPALWHSLLLTDAHNTIDPPIWSLAVELRVALIFPILALSARRFPVATIAICALAVYPCQRLMRLELSPILTEAADTGRYLVLFAAGSAFALHRNRLAAFYRNTSPTNRFLMWAAALAFLEYRFFPAALPEQVWVPWLGALLLFPLIAQSTAAAVLLRTGPAQFLGRISFSLYLCHVPVMVMLVARYGIAGAILAVPVSIALAWPMFRLIEAPANRLGHALTRPHGRSRPADRREPAN